MDADNKDKEIIFLRDEVYQQQMQISDWDILNFGKGKVEVKRKVKDL